MKKNDETKRNVSEVKCVALQIRRAGRQVTQLYDHCMRPAGIRSTQYGLLRCIAALPEAFISDIGRVLDMDQTTATRNVETLEKSGLVETGPYPDDPRKKRVVLSPKGVQKMEEAHVYWEKAQEIIRSRMGEEDLKQLFALLTKLSDAAKG